MNDKIEKFKIHCNIKNNNYYDYSLVMFDKLTDVINIICPIHGVFSQRAKHHKRGQGCKHCNMGAPTLKEEDILQRFIQKHGNKYNYSNFKYINTTTKSIIICDTHGDFLQTPHAHLVSGCPKCAAIQIGNSKRDICRKTKIKYNNEILIDIFNKVHNYKYEYPNFNYVGSSIKYKFICPKHGEFEQSLQCHMRGSGCYYCGKAKSSKGRKPNKYDNGILYLINFFNEDENEDFYKIGITKRTLKARWHGKKNNYIISNIHTISGNLLSLYHLEQSILKNIDNYIPKQDIKGGKTECFLADKNQLAEIILLFNLSIVE